MTRGARYAVVFLFCLSFALATGNFLWNASQVRQIRQAAASTVQLCRSGNEARAQQVQLWTHLIEISMPPPHQTARQREERARTIREFETYVHKVFAPRNCQRFH